MCEVWDRRNEAIMVGSASRIDDTAFYEYHRSFSARAAALIQQQNVKGDPRQWSVFVCCLSDRKQMCVRCVAV